MSLWALAFCKERRSVSCMPLLVRSAWCVLRPLVTDSDRHRTLLWERKKTLSEIRCYSCSALSLSLLPISPRLFTLPDRLSWARLVALPAAGPSFRSQGDSTCSRFCSFHAGSDLDFTPRPSHQPPTRPNHQTPDRHTFGLLLISLSLLSSPFVTTTCLHNLCHLQLVPILLRSFLHLRIASVSAPRITSSLDNHHLINAFVRIPRSSNFDLYEYGNCPHFWKKRVRQTFWNWTFVTVLDIENNQPVRCMEKIPNLCSGRLKQVWFCTVLQRQCSERTRISSQTYPTKQYRLYCVYVSDMCF